MDSYAPDRALEAAKLLRELEKEAEKKVLAAYLFTDNLVKGAVIDLASVSVGDAGRSIHEIRIVFSVNGRDLKTIQKVEGVASVALYDKGKAFSMLTEAVGKAIALEVQDQAMHWFGDQVCATSEFKGGK